MITKYGTNTFLFVVFFALILAVIAYFMNSGWIKYPLYVISISIFLFSVNFFRDPERTPPAEDNVIVSPADGEVIIIKDIEDTRFINGKAKQVSIFMSPFNVHVNRIPVSGKVDYYKYIPGEYLMAYYEKADERNERSEIGISGKYGKVLFTQVAGFIARRIVCTLNVNDQVTMGDRFGMIKFGSRSDIIVPFDWELKVKKGDVVFAGETVIFEYNQ